MYCAVLNNSSVTREKNLRVNQVLAQHCDLYCWRHQS